MNFTEWWNNIDWSATGAMIGAIASCFAIFFAIRIGNKQNKLTKQISSRTDVLTEWQIKISLYDKRYTIYQCFMKYIKIANEFFQNKVKYNDKTMGWLNKIKERLFDNIDNIGRQHDLALLGQLQLESGSLDTLEKINKLEAKMGTENISLILNDRATIASAKFCFNKINCFEDLEKFVGSITAIANCIENANFDLDELFKNAQDSFESIIKNNVQDVMEEELNLTYSSLIKESNYAKE